MIFHLGAVRSRPFAPYYHPLSHIVPFGLEGFKQLAAKDAIAALAGRIEVFFGITSAMGPGNDVIPLARPLLETITARGIPWNFSRIHRPFFFLVPRK